MPRKVITEQLKVDIIDFYKNNKVSLQEVATKFNLSFPTISKILSGIKKYTKNELFNPDLNESYFSKIDYGNKAYFIGLLIADGNVFKYTDNSNRQASISVTLAEEDSYILYKFKEELNSKTALIADKRRDSIANTFAFRSNKIADDLAKYSIIPNKTFHTYLPEVPEQYMSDLIRGILDGDGSIRCKQGGKENRNRFFHYIGFCGTHKLMQDISDYLSDKLNLNVRPKVYDYKDRNLSEIHISNIADICKVGDFLYKDAELYLIRKYNKFINIKNHYNIQDNTELTE